MNRTVFHGLQYPDDEPEPLPIGMNYIDATNHLRTWDGTTWRDDGPVSDEATIAVVNGMAKDDRATPPEPVTHPRTATMTILDDGSHLLVIQNGDCVASVTLTAAQVIAWEFRETTR